MEFDQYSENYNQALRRGVALSGESPDYFAKLRVSHIYDYWSAQAKDIQSIMEFGCGTGNNIRYLREFFPESQITGVDISSECLDVAQRRYEDDLSIRFSLVSNLSRSGSVDMVFVNGVFHHIPSDQHTESLEMISAALKKGARLSLFENNPFNPGTHLVMKRIPFDKDAVMICPYRLARMVQAVGLGEVAIRFYFIFPRILQWFRPMERFIEKVPFGAQYCIFARNI